MATRTMTTEEALEEIARWDEDPDTLAFTAEQVTTGMVEFHMDLDTSEITVAITPLGRQVAAEGPEGGPIGRTLRGM
jgi:hypothetical protein